MSWGFTANGDFSTDTLANFENMVDNNQYCGHRKQLKEAAKALCAGMADDEVKSITTFGRTDGQHHAVAVCINCCVNG